MKHVLIAFLAALLLLPGCGGPQGVSPDAPLAQRVIPVYRLAADDKLKINVFGEEALSGEFVVSGEGTVAFPLIGTVKAGGLTVPEFETQLQTRLATLVNKPRVAVAITDYRPFFILGEVNRAGQYPYRVGLTVNSAVATAGGFTYRANQKDVLIQHFGEAGEREYQLTSELSVLPGDTIRIKERFF